MPRFLPWSECSISELRMRTATFFKTQFRCSADKAGTSTITVRPTLSSLRRRGWAWLMTHHRCRDGRGTCHLEAALNGIEVELVQASASARQGPVLIIAVGFGGLVLSGAFASGHTVSCGPIVGAIVGSFGVAASALTLIYSTYQARSIERTSSDSYRSLQELALTRQRAYLSEEEGRMTHCQRPRRGHYGPGHTPT